MATGPVGTVVLKPFEAVKKPADQPSKSPVPVATGAAVVFVEAVVLVELVDVVLEAACRSLIDAVWTGLSI